MTVKVPFENLSSLTLCPTLPLLSCGSWDLDAALSEHESHSKPHDRKTYNNPLKNRMSTRHHHERAVVVPSISVYYI